MFLHEVPYGSLVDVDGIIYEVSSRMYFRVLSGGDEVPEGMIPLCTPVPDDALYWVFCPHDAMVDLEGYESDSFSKN